MLLSLLAVDLLSYNLSSSRDIVLLQLNLSIGINVRFAAMMADVGDGLL